MMKMKRCLIVTGGTIDIAFAKDFLSQRECGVKTAVQEHKIGQSRYDNYRLMYQELKEKKKYGRSSR